MTFSAPKGTFDQLPPDSERLLVVRDALAAGPRAAGFGYIETPTFEETALFVRGVGESSDVVTKEMYSFTTRGGQDVTLRPEGTASVMRAVLEHHLDRGPLPVKLWYSGSFYRYERPQAGRYRHFSQVGAETLGTEDPAADAEIIALAVAGYARLGLTQVRVLLNSLGCSVCRPVYRAALTAFLDGLDLDEPTRARARINPLRVLDDKRPEMIDALAAAPLVRDSLCADCRQHYDDVRQLLADTSVVWEEAPRLVRGLDYYTRTTFEFQHDGLGAQSAIGGGGRYDGLAEDVGGPRLPGVGWALGADRTLLAVDAESIDITGGRRLGVYAVGLGEDARRKIFALVAALRTAGVSADMSFGDRGLKGALKAADRSGARFALVVGERDLTEGVAQLKDLDSGDQRAVALDAVVDEVGRTLT
jgi:histidyl-tRNA synthetase